MAKLASLKSEKRLLDRRAADQIRSHILEGVLPVSDYTSTVDVKAGAGGKSIVTWSGHFKRKNVGDHPAANEDDKTATDTMSAVYQAGLDNLSKMLGS